MASKRILEDMGAWSSGDDLELDEEFASARDALGEAEFQSAWEAGQYMTLEEAIEFALGEEVETDK